MRKIVCVVATLLMACAAGTRSRATTEDIVLDKDVPTWTGTFTDLRVTDDGVFGVEIRTAVTDRLDGQAVVQFGYGDFCLPSERGRQPCFRVSNLLVVDLAKTTAGDPTNSLKFKIAGPEFAGKFEGQVSKKELIGTFTFASGRSLAVRLPRGISHWEK